MSSFVFWLNVFILTVVLIFLIALIVVSLMKKNLGDEKYIEWINRIFASAALIAFIIFAIVRVKVLRR